MVTKYGLLRPGKLSAPKSTQANSSLINKDQISRHSFLLQQSRCQVICPAPCVAPVFRCLMRLVLSSHAIHAAKLSRKFTQDTQTNGQCWTAFCRGATSASKPKASLDPQEPGFLDDMISQNMNIDHQPLKKANICKANGLTNQQKHP